MQIFYIVPAFSDQAGQCRIVMREFDKPIDAAASYRESPELWKEAGLMNSRGQIVHLVDEAAYKEMAQDEPLMAGVQYSMPSKSPSDRPGKVFHVTAAGFDASSDETDDHVFWVTADTEKAVLDAIQDTGATFCQEVPGSCADDADFDLNRPGQAAAFATSLLEKASAHRNRNRQV